MILTLEVTGPEAGKLGAAHRKVFDAAGGTIGRLPDNTWVLLDPYVSSRHAVIRYTGGVFYIEDTSTNGVFINSPDRRLGLRQPYALQSGDRIFIEPYEIRASITDAPVEAAPPPRPVAADPFALDDPFSHPSAPMPRAAAVPRIPSEPGAPLEPFVGEDVDPLNLLGLDSQRAPVSNAPRAADLARNSVMSDQYEPPDVVKPPPPIPVSSPGLIPDEYDPLGTDDSQILRPAAQPFRAADPPVRAAERAVEPRASRSAPPASKPLPAAPSSGDSSLAAVLAGAGLENVPVTPELARNFGQILRIVVAGVMDVLQARQRIKDEFRMRVTSFKRADNNPLKFSANVDDALHNLLVKRNAAYLAPVDAFEDAFDDLRNHQMAMLAGVRVAFEAMLAEFDPDRLQETFDRELKKGALLSMPAKLRYWELYRDKVHDMVRDADESFRELFGEEFAKAYEAQLERLKAQNRSGKR
ncbi:MAG: type VI secretion system-associated FHA domain protein TagH [Steroidobacteraceae bacterium]